MIDVPFGKNRDVDENGQANDEVLSVASEWLLYNSDTFTLAEGEHKKEGIMVDIPNDAPKGEYIFDVRVFRSGALYGNPQKFYVNVK